MEGGKSTFEATSRGNAAITATAGSVSNRAGHSSKGDLNSQIIVQTVNNIINNKKYTPYDLQKILRKSSSHCSLMTTLLDDGLNLLQASIDKGRLCLLPVFLHLGWWKVLTSQKVPQDAITEHKGRTAMQIAESKRTRKPLDEFNVHNEWEHSLSALMKACRSGDVLKAKQLMENGGVEIFHLDNNQGNALFWTVVSGNMELFHELVEMGLDANMRTKKKETLLHVACIMGHHSMVTELVQKYKIDPWLEDSSHKTCHDRIAENGDIDTLKELIKCKILPKSNVASLAAYAGRSPYLVYLLDVLHNPINSADIYDRTALHRSLEAGNFAIAKYLVDKGADITLYTKMGRNVLHIIAEEGSAETMQWMISVLKSSKLLGDMLDVQDRYNGVDLCFLIRGRDKGRDAFHYVEVERSMVPLFLKRTRCGNVDVSIFGRVLKSEWGVNPDQDTVDDIEEIFKNRRLDQNAQIDQTPLHIAIAKSKFDVAKILIENGANIHICDKFGQTALFYAVSRGNLELVSLLEKQGADFNLVDKSGKTLKNIAEENEHTEISNFLSGRSSFDLVENFRAGPLQRLNGKISSEQLQRQRTRGTNMKHYLVQSLREMTSEINHLLMKMDSGPVVEETGDGSDVHLGSRMLLPNAEVSYDSGLGPSVRNSVTGSYVSK